MAKIVFILCLFVSIFVFVQCFSVDSEFSVMKKSKKSFSWPPIYNYHRQRISPKDDSIMWPMPLMMMGPAALVGLKRSSSEETHFDKEDTVTPFNVPLDVDSKIIMHWGLDYFESKVLFKITFESDVPEFEAFSFGWSNYGEFNSADYCLLWFGWDGAAYLQDTHSDEEGRLLKDKHNDCLNAKWSDKDRILTFTRYFNTCDEDDYVIEDGTTHIVWMMGTATEMTSPTPPSRKGMVRVQLLKNMKPIPPIPNHARSLTLTADKVHVPPIDTLYWCHVHQMPSWLTEKPHHIIRYEPQIQKGNEGLVHHMELFYCDSPPEEEIPLYVGPCFGPDRPETTKVCSKVRSAWAMGAGPFIYPRETGLPIGGPKSNKYIMLEVHYNNPEKRGDWVDSSGIQTYLTSQLRPHDAAIMELGLEYTDKMAIPPAQDLFQLSGYCISDCTDISLPSRGITIFGSQLHTHLTGTKVVTRHFRRGKELPYLNRDNHYSTHFQEIRLLKRPTRILPGDFLITTCDFDTSSRVNMTFGGHAITDEMCVNYMHYYPASKLEVCKSSVGTNALANYFMFLKKWENMAIEDGQTIREKYGSVHNWTPARVDFLKLLYDESAISMQCNASDGTRFPGQWDNVPTDVILTKLPTPKRQCPANDDGD